MPLVKTAPFKTTKINNLLLGAKRMLNFSPFTKESLQPFDKSNPNNENIFDKKYFLNFDLKIPGTFIKHLNFVEAWSAFNLHDTNTLIKIHTRFKHPYTIREERRGEATLV